MNMKAEMGKPRNARGERPGEGAPQSTEGTSPVRTFTWDLLPPKPQDHTLLLREPPASGTWAWFAPDLSQCG